MMCPWQQKYGPALGPKALLAGKIALHSGCAQCAVKAVIGWVASA